MSRFSGEVALLAMAALAAVATSACAVLMPKDPNSREGILQCSAGPERTFDLGNGTIADIRRKAPEFFDLRPEGYERPNTFFGADAEKAQRDPMLAANRRRTLALQESLKNDNPDQVALQPVHDADLDVVELMADTVAPHIRSWTSGNKENGISVLVTAAECPSITATDRCENGILSTRVRTLRKPCEAQDANPTTFSLAFDQNSAFSNTTNGDAINVQPGKVVHLEVPVVLASYRSPKDNAPKSAVLLNANHHKTFWKGLLGDGDVQGATVLEVLSVLDDGDLQFAAALYGGMKSPDAATTAKINERYVERVRSGLDGAKGLEAAGKIANALGRPPTGLPGDEEVGKLVVTHFLADDDRVRAAPPTPSTWTLRFGTLEIARRWQSVSRNPEVETRWDAIQKEAGELITGTDPAPELVSLLRAYVPDSPYLRQFDAKNAQAAVAQQAALETANLWHDVQEAGDDIAQKRYVDEFVRANAMTVRNARALQRAAVFVRGEIAETYCPAKKAFVKNTNAAEFNKRVAGHCKDDPPTGNGPGGGSVTLTMQCRAAFATPCP